MSEGFDSCRLRPFPFPKKKKKCVYKSVSVMGFSVKSGEMLLGVETLLLFCAGEWQGCVCVCVRARARVHACAARVGEVEQMGGVQVPGVRLKFGGCRVSRWHFYYVFGLAHVCCISEGFLCVSSKCFLVDVWWLCSLTDCMYRSPVPLL